VPPDATAALDALRERGAHRIDPIRFRLTESLVQRAAAHGGPARKLLDGRVTALLEAMDEAVTLATSRPVDAAIRVDPGQSQPSEMARLVAHIAQHKPGGTQAIAPQTLAMPAASMKAEHGSPVDPKTLQFFRRTWSRLSADQRLAQSRSSLPENAGPLNSQHLVHRSLKVMRELSPEYFDLFIAHVDTLLWLERANEQAARDVGLPPRAKAGRKPTNAKRG
jgi:hypothetical protein